MIQLRITEIVDAFVRHADIWSWYNYFSNCPQHNLQKYEMRAAEVDYEQEFKFHPLKQSLRDALQWNVRCKAPKQPLAKPPSAEKEEEGDVASIDPWISAALLLTPLQYSSVQLPKTSPGVTLSPAWIYGYQAEKTRGNVRYASSGAVVYPVSKYIVVYSVEQHEQIVFTGHNEEVVSLAMHPVRDCFRFFALVVHLYGIARACSCVWRSRRSIRNVVGVAMREHHYQYRQWNPHQP